MGDSNRNVPVQKFTFILTTERLAMNIMIAKMNILIAITDEYHDCKVMNVMIAKMNIMIAKMNITIVNI